MKREDFVKELGPGVKKACEGTGLFPSVTLAQMVLETSTKPGEAGNSPLCEVHNYFGIKADASWKGPVKVIETREVVGVLVAHLRGKLVKRHKERPDGRWDIWIDDHFRAYDSVEVGVANRNEFLKENPRYTKAGVFEAVSPTMQCAALLRAGYATDPNYATVLISIIKNLKLEVFD
jgi:flagellum-specific peptidoglycan hydrolase FlgJ